MKKTERTHNIRNERRDITTDAHRNNEGVREYYQQFYANKLNTLKKMHKFLETYNLWRLNHEELENLKWTIPRRETESVIKCLQINKSPGIDGFTGLNSIKHLKKK